MKKEWNFLRSEDCTDEFSANSTRNVFSRICCAKHEKHDRREPGLSKGEFCCTEMICLCGKTYSCYDSKSQKSIKISSKGLIKTTLEDCGDGRKFKYRKVWEKIIIVTSKN